MKRKTRIATVIMSMILITMCFSGESVAESNGSGEDYYYTGTLGTCSYTLYKDGSLIIEPISGESGELANWNTDEYGVPPWYEGFHESECKIKSVRFVGNIKAKTCHYMFLRLGECSNIDFSGLDTSNVTDMEGMFSGCTKLKSIDLDALDTTNVTNMGAMFVGWSNLSSADLSGLDTSNVTDMSNMFAMCSSVDVSSLNTSKVRNMSEMFYSAKGITGLKYLDTSSVTDMSEMFSYAEMATIDISSFNLGKVKDLSEMFTYSTVATIKLPSSPVGANCTANAMFANCNNLSSVNIGAMDTSNVTNMSGMFAGCSNLVSINAPQIETSGATSMKEMFSGCSAFKSIDVSAWDTGKVTNMNHLFCGCSSIEAIDISSWDTGSVTGMIAMFGDCTALKTVKLGNIDTSAVKNVSEMFSGCSTLSQVDLQCFKKALLEDVSYLFSDAGIRSIDLSGLNLSKDCNVKGMFCGCKELRDVNLDCFAEVLPSNLSELFKNCKNIKTIDLSKLNTSNTSWMNEMFSCCYSLQELDLSGFDTSHVSDMEGMFFGCASLEELDLSSFNTAGVSNMDDMFNGCSAEMLDLSSFELKSLRTSSNFLQGSDVKILSVGQGWTRSIWFPTSMHEEGHPDKVFTEQDFIPEGYAATYIAEGYVDSSLIMCESQRNVTEDQLFGEYCQYLNNKTYMNMCGEIRNEIAKTIPSRMPSAADTTYLISWINSHLKQGTDSFLHVLLDGEKLDRMELEDEVVRELLFRMQEDEAVLAANEAISFIDDAFSEFKGKYSSATDIYGDPNTLKEVAKDLAEITGKENKTVMKELQEIKPSVKKAGNGLDYVEYAVDAVDLIAIMYESDMIQHKTIELLMDSVDKKTALYKGLSRMDKASTVTLFAANLASDKGIEYLISKIPGSDNSTLLCVDLSLRIAASLQKQIHDVDDYDKAIINEANSEALESARIRLLGEIGQNYLDNKKVNKKLKNKYEVVYKAKMASLEQGVEYACKIASSDEEEAINKKWEKYNSHLTYDKYISSCLYNAKQAYKYRIKNGKAYIVNKNTEVTAAKSAMKSASVRKAAAGEAEGFMVDIPEYIGEYPVGGIEAEGLANEQDLGIVTIPDSLESVKGNAFNNCSNLTTVYGGNMMSTVGDTAFSDCSSLEDIYLSCSVQDLGKDILLNSDNAVVHTSDETLRETLGDAKTEITDPGVLTIAVSGPDKTVYKPNEEVDTTGLKVTAYFDNGTSADVTDAVCCEIDDRTPGERHLVVVFDSFTELVPITIENGSCSYYVECIDADTGDLISETVKTGESGATVNEEPPVIDGYTALSENAESSAEEGQTIVFFYRKGTVADIADAEVTVPEKVGYTGEPVNPEISVKLGEDILKNGQDYAVLYENNVEMGTATATIMGINHYKGTKTVSFKIEETDGDQGASGEASGGSAAPAKTQPQTQQAAQLSEIVDLPKVKISRPKAAKKAVTVKWKKLSKKNKKKVSKIQIQISKDRSFSTVDKQKFASVKKTSLKVKGLKKKKTYYVRIRSFKVINGKVHVSKWSSVKKFRMK